jgi:NAD(P)H-flavin reductase
MLTTNSITTTGISTLTPSDYIFNPGPLTNPWSTGTISNSAITLNNGYISYSTNNLTNNLTNQIMQNKVVVFKVTRDEKEKIVKTEFLKEMWVETKGSQSVEFQVARDKDLAKYEMTDLFIKVIYSVTF